MKKLVIVLISFIIMAGTGYAQDQVKNQNNEKNHNHFIFKEGKMMQIMEGEQTMLQTQLRLENGTIVNTDGSYNYKNKKMKQLREGECLDMEGIRYRNQEHFENRMNHRYNKEMRMNERNKNMEQGGIKVKGKGKKGKNN